MDRVQKTNEKRVGEAGILKRGILLLFTAAFLWAASGCDGAGGNSETAEWKDASDKSAPAAADDSASGERAETEPDPATAEPGRDKFGYIMISSPESFELLRKYPNDRFHVVEDVDFRGAEVEPIECFSGELTGTFGGEFNHTISNVKIRVKEGETAAGLFATLLGTVKNLNLENVTMELPDGFSGRAGILAGAELYASPDSGQEGFGDAKVRNVRILNASVTGKAEGADIGLLAGILNEAADCFVSGSVSLELTESDASSFIGTAAGKASWLSNVESEADLTLTGCGTDLSAGGIAGGLSGGTKVIYGGHLTIDVDGAPSALGTVIGLFPAARASGESLEPPLIETVYNSAKSVKMLVDGEAVDRPFTGNDADHLIRHAYRRDLSNLDETTLPEAERKLRETVTEYMIREITVPWQPQQNMDYSDNCASRHVQHYEKYEWYFGLPYTHYCGSLERFQQYLEGGKLQQSVPRTGWETYLGNDCADAVYWAWARVSPSITYTLTENMIVQNGTVQVGDYQLVDHEETKATCEANGIEVMAEAYACLRAGDAVLYGPGHVRMAAEAPTVIRNEDGSIDPVASYLLCHEQGNLAELQARHTTCNYRRAYTFAQLFVNHYIPITIPEFAAGEAGEWTASVDDPLSGTYDGVFYGRVTSNYRIDSVRTVITDRKTGETVIDYAYFPNSGKHVNEMDLSAFRFSAGVRKLAAGDYHYVLYLSTGAGVRVLEEYDFTKQ